ncbi:MULTISPECIES: hypothetical protein [Roseomonadaceae]|uniref:Lipoprotein n=1 Tax=Falsiroseomonas oleicola TaxID=2801474 RepID=A0ABS6HBG1_9PROT|nr:hypothetical protein [Roseomonas oleicola]MBU8545691.1 hypothetical protein [Roseomonas oleicola]
MMRTMLKAGCALGVPVLLAGCNWHTGSGNGGPVTAVEMTTRHERSTAVVALRDTCPVTGGFADLQTQSAPSGGPQRMMAGGVVLGALAPVAVDFVISAITDYLKRAEEERDANWRGSGETALGTGSRCLIVARGSVGSYPADVPQAQGLVTAENMRTVGLTAPPAFYMEAQLDVTAAAPGVGGSQGATLMLRPRYLHFARTAATRGTDDPKAIGMVLVLRGTPARENATSGTAAEGADAVFALNFGRVAPGTQIIARDGTTGDPFADLAMSITVPRMPARANMLAFTAETADEDRILNLLNEAWKGNATGVGDALTKAIQDVIVTAQQQQRPAGQVR